MRIVMRGVAAQLIILTFGITNDLIAQQITSVTPNPNPFPVGIPAVQWTATCTAAPSQCEWEWRCTEGGVNAAWNPIPPLLTLQPGAWSNEPRVGSQELRVKGFWPQQGPMGMNAQPITSIKVITLTPTPPSSDVIVSGLNTDSSPWPMMSIPLVFEVRCGTMKMGSMVAGYPSELILEYPMTDPPVVLGDSTVKPGAFELRPQGIWDNKVFIYDRAVWDSIAIGGSLMQYYQSNYMTIKDCHGNNKIFLLSTHHLKNVKSTAETFKIVEVPIP